MNTLQDLRATLDQHAHEVSDDPALARVAAVRGRARRVRQRRAGAVVVGAVLAVVGVVLVPSLGDRTPPVAVAPDTMTALGWTYERRGSASGDGRVTLRLAESDAPRLVSWATSGSEQAVLVTRSGETWESDSADYADHVWIPPQFEGRVSIKGPQGLTVATYLLDASRPPEGIGEGALTFRADVAGRELLGASLGDVGDDAVEVSIPATRQMLWVADLCEGIPQDAVVRLDYGGRRGFTSGGCDNTVLFDPGGSAGTGYRGYGVPQTLRMTVWRDGSRLTSDDLGDARLGLGVYAVTEPELRLAGRDFERSLEHDGRVWELADQMTAQGEDLASLRVPDDGMYVVEDSLRSFGSSFSGLAVDGRVDSFNQSMFRTSGGTTQVVRPGQDVTIKVGRRTEVRDSALVLYRLRD